jgi:hypothetical protein
VDPIGQQWRPLAAPPIPTDVKDPIGVVENDLEPFAVAIVPLE